MANKFKFLIIILAVAIIVPQITLAAWWNPFSWGVWNRIFHFQQQAQKIQQPIVGGDKDAHGCIGSAGYSWCEAKQKCLRVWEEKCQPDSVVFSDNCNTLISQINDLVERANYCNADSDCVISTRITKFCGCYGLLNKNANLETIQRGNGKYTSLNCPVTTCSPCFDPHNLLNNQQLIKCINKKCVAPK